MITIEKAVLFQFDKDIGQHEKYKEENLTGGGDRGAEWSHLHHSPVLLTRGLGKI